MNINLVENPNLINIADVIICSVDWFNNSKFAVTLLLGIPKHNTLLMKLREAYFIILKLKLPILRTDKRVLTNFFFIMFII